MTFLKVFSCLSFQAEVPAEHHCLPKHVTTAEGALFDALHVVRWLGLL